MKTIGMRKILLVWVSVSLALLTFAQKKTTATAGHCATMDLLEHRLSADPSARARYQEELSRFNATVQRRGGQQQRTTQLSGTIPVVIHIVMPNPALVTDAQISQQLALLNASFNGTQSDAGSIPSYFAGLLGNSGIRFCLAQQTPDGEATTGIIRKTTSVSGFNYLSEDIKYAEDGGADAWDPSRYFNIWIGTLTGNILGYATFPDQGAALEQGVVVDYRALPGGSYTAYNQGKTMVHEVGHFFNLYHIWGDDSGTCTGTDFVDDTPNQGGASSGCSSGIRTDLCTPAGNGIMYQNYMDYSNDECLLLFTTGQADRMTAAAEQYRASLFQSDACSPPTVFPLDLQATGIDRPASRECISNLVPVVRFRNRGASTVTSARVQLFVNNLLATETNWTGSLATGAETSVSLGNITLPQGRVNITARLSQPNGGADGREDNDSVQRSVVFNTATDEVSQGFETTSFPPESWDIVNPNNDITWERTTAASRSGNGSVYLNNFDNSRIGRIDDLRLPQLNLANKDSAFLSFWVAAAVYSGLATQGNNWDTLQVLVSRDCGQTYTSVYKKWAGTLVTQSSVETVAFVPATNEWRKDSVNLGSFIGQGDLLVAFRNSTGYENNVYLDDIRLRTVTINPNLKAKGFLVTPNPANSFIEVQFFPNPSNLNAILIYNMQGQLMEKTLTDGAGQNYYRYDVSRWPAGQYVVRAQFRDQVLTRRVIKL